MTTFSVAEKRENSIWHVYLAQPSLAQLRSRILNLEKSKQRSTCTYFGELLIASLTIKMVAYFSHEFDDL